jgi:hypothetical protein
MEPPAESAEQIFPRQAVFSWINKEEGLLSDDECPYFSRLNRMLTLFYDKLPAELWLIVFSQLGSDATPRDWLTVGLVCKEWQEARPKWFEEWLRIQPLRRRFCSFEGTKIAEGLGCVREQLSGK